MNIQYISIHIVNEENTTASNFGLYMMAIWDKHV